LLTLNAQGKEKEEAGRRGEGESAAVRFFRPSTGEKDAKKKKKFNYILPYS